MNYGAFTGLTDLYLSIIHSTTVQKVGAEKKRKKKPPVKPGSSFL